MRTLRYEPVPAWEHALNDADCADHLLLVVEDGSQVVGWCRTLPVNCQSDRSTVASLGVGLLPDYRNRGIGTALVSASLDWANKAGMTRITLTTRPDNQRAMHVFRKRGLILTGDEHNGAIEMGIELGEKEPCKLLIQPR